MIYSIVAIGDPVLKTKAKNLAPALPAAELQTLIADMFETMYYAHGVGLAAPQIGKGVRLFVMDSGRWWRWTRKTAKRARSWSRP